MKYIILFMVSLLIIGGCAFNNNVETDNNSNQNVGQSNNTNVNNSEAGAAPEQPTGTPVAQYTLDEVAKHSTASDCWTVANAKVYDVTSYVSQHPGGDKILLGCGKDMTDFFNSKHLKQSKEQLPQFYIGDLK